MSSKFIKQHLTLQVLQTALAFLWIFFTRTDNTSTFFLWFSKSNFLQLLIVSALLLLFLAALVWLSRSVHAEELPLRLDQFLIEKRRLIPVLIVLLAFVSVLISVVAAIVRTPVIESHYGLGASATFPVLHTLTMRSIPLLSLIILASIECILLLVYLYRKQVVLRTMWSIELIAPTIVAVALVLFTLAHWLILALQLRTLTINPAWYWAIESKPFSIRDLFYLLPVLVLLGLTVWLIASANKAAYALIVIFILGWWLQIGIGFLEGSGMHSLQARYFNTYHRTYPYFASQNHSTTLTMMRSYEETLTKSLFTSTKPPGLMAFYFTLERIVNGNPRNSLLPDDVRLSRLSNVITLAFPFAAASMVVMIYAFSRQFLTNADPCLPTVLYVLSPNIVMFSLFVDQAVYPILFLVGAWLVFSLLKRDSLVLAFLVGLALYLLAFITFAMLPLFPVAGIFLALLWWQKPDLFPLMRQVKTGISLLIGVTSSYWLLRWIFNYDFFTRFSKTVQINHNFDFYSRVGLTPPVSPEPIGVRIHQILHAAWWNNLEFATAAGVVVYLLFLMYAIRLVVRLFRRHANPSELVLSSFFLAFVVLNAAGSIQGEVARLWMFWMPMVVVFAAQEVVHWTKKSPPLLTALFLTQVLTILLTYHFQEFRM
jgi:hypothetical protein